MWESVKPWLLPIVPELPWMIPALLLALQPYLPGPVRNMINAFVHRRDVALIGSALLNRALAMNGKLDGPALVQDIIKYVKITYPDTTTKLNPMNVAYETMAEAAIQQAKAVVTKAVVVPLVKE